MDRAVLDAFGWYDISTECEFILDYEIDEESWGNKKKPFRYRWPDHIRDDVLARLLKLNTARAAAEAREGQGADGSTPASSPRIKATGGSCSTGSRCSHAVRGCVVGVEGPLHGI